MDERKLPQTDVQYSSKLTRPCGGQPDMDPARRKQSQLFDYLQNRTADIYLGSRGLAHEQTERTH